MKTRALTLPAWVEDEWMLLRYLMSPHEGHAYPEDVIDAISLITSWALIFAAGIAALTVLATGLIR